jgi:hypothetical protein
LSEELKPISLNPDDFVQGGLVDDIDVTLTKLRFMPFDYQGKSDPILALLVQMKDADGTEYEQYYSAGDPKRYTIIQDGKAIASITGGGSLVKSSNASQFINSIVNSGFSKNLLGAGDVTAFEGTNCHVRRVAQEKRAGLTQQADASGREKTILLVTKINSLPGEKMGKGTAAKATAAKATAAAPAASNGSGELTDRAVEIVMGILAENGGTILKSKLPTAVFQAAKDDPNKGKLSNLAFSPEFLGAEGRPWSFNAAEGTVALA